MRHDDHRHGAKQPHRFDPSRAALLDDPERFAYLPVTPICELLALEPGTTVVDFGAGTGTYAIAIGQAWPDTHVYALDEQPEMLALLQAKLASSGVANVEAVGADAGRQLRGRIQRVLALNVLHELGDSALADVRSLLSVSGRALFVDWNADVERPHGPRRAHVYGVDEAHERLCSNGFTIVGAKLFPYHYALVAEPTR